MTAGPFNRLRPRADVVVEFRHADGRFDAGTKLGKIRLDAVAENDAPQRVGYESALPDRDGDVGAELEGGGAGAGSWNL